MPQWVLEGCSMKSGNPINQKVWDKAQEFLKDKKLIVKDCSDSRDVTMHYCFLKDYQKTLPSYTKKKKKKYKKPPIEQTIMYKKRKKYKEVLIKSLNTATSWEEFYDICKPAAAIKYIKQFGLEDLKNKKSQEWKKNKYWTTKNCGYCDTEFPIRKKLLKTSPNKQHYCSAKCYENNKSNIAQSLLKEKFQKMDADWDKVKVHKLEHYTEYRKLVTAWSTYNLKTYNPKMFREWKNPNNDFQLDHKWAVIHAFYRGINPQLVSHIDNLQLLTPFENQSKNDKWIDEIIPDVLREASEQPIDLSRFDRLNPPYVSRAAKPDSKCIHCDKEYFEHKSNADKPESYCAIRCEKKDWLTPDKEKMLYDLLKEKILSLDWETISDITKPIKDMYGSYMIGGRDIIRDIFYGIWKDEFNLPTDNVKGSLERKLIECNEDYSFPKSYRGPFKLKCKDCGKVTITKYRNSLVRFHGIVEREDVKNPCYEICKTCSVKKSNTGVSRGGWTARNAKLKKEYGERLSQWI